ncbi:hypothetical protein B0H66DRAFT_546300 [Apodospora peruviana]|uniref:Rhodopsin domain-containing protein n=1 Tax=Apodospora peruviana TaxID=516989 RepID=A0AAE0IVH5_9PEZI|nr:hypothetical protein B0H66DRAFT_546300 [Apodospora peruviana]
MSAPSMQPGAGGIVETTDQLVSEHSFRIVLWVGISLCLVASVVRSYIRYVCFGKLLVEDYLMIGAFLTLVAIVALLLKFLGDVYWMLDVQNGRIMPGPDLFKRMETSLRAVGLISILTVIGIWTIKMNFLLFFYRLGHQIKLYLIFWWVAVALTIACGAAALGMIPYHCHFRDAQYIMQTCGSNDGINHVYTVYKASVSVDVCSDVIILCFPIIILWRTRIGLRQKLVLSSIFSLVGFTIAVTIVRGSIFGGMYKSLEQVDRKVMDTSWMEFWYIVQYVTSFVVACLVSFRSLWAHREQKSKDRSEKERLAARLRAEQQQMKQKSAQSSQEHSLRVKLNKLHDSVLDTFRDLEGTSLNGGDDFIFLDNRPASSIMLAGEFMPDGHDVNWSTTSKTRVDNESQVDSLRSLTRD